MAGLVKDYESVSRLGEPAGCVLATLERQGAADNAVRRQPPKLAVHEFRRGRNKNGARPGETHNSRSSV